MQRLRRQELPPYLYHGTRAGNYKSILRSGLLAGGPSGCHTDIHLVEHLPYSGRRVLSGWRSNCELAIQVTPQAASSGGCTFYYSDNGVYLTEGVRGAIAPQFISAVVILQSGEVITSPRVGTAPTGEAVAAGLRRAREARGGYMCAAIVALFCHWPLLALVPYWCAQAAAEALVWYPQLPEQVRTPTFESLRCTAVGDLPRAHVPRALEPTVGWPMDWPVGPLQFASVSTCTLHATVRTSTFYLCHLLPGRVVSKLDCVVPWRLLRGPPGKTAPLGAASSHMSYTPNSEDSPLWSPVRRNQRTSRHHRHRLHQLCRRRPPERILLAEPLLATCSAGLFAEGSMPRQFFVSWSRAWIRTGRQQLPPTTTLMLPMSRLPCLE